MLSETPPAAKRPDPHFTDSRPRLGQVVPGGEHCLGGGYLDVSFRGYGRRPEANGGGAGPPAITTRGAPVGTVGTVGISKYLWGTHLRMVPTVPTEKTPVRLPAARHTLPACPDRGVRTYG
jgi:hypothetical protein